MSSSLTGTMVQGTDKADVISVNKAREAFVAAGGGDDIVTADLSGRVEISGGTGNDAVIIGASIKAVTCTQGADGRLVIRSIADPSHAIIVASDVERIRFSEGVQTFKQLWDLSGTAASSPPGTQAPSQPVVPATNAATGSPTAPAAATPAGATASMILGTAQADAIVVEGRGTATVDAGAGADLIQARLDGQYTVKGGAGNDGLIVRGSIGSASLHRGEDGSLTIRSAADPTKWINVAADVERIRFDERAYTFAEAWQLATPPAAPVVVAPTPTTIQPLAASLPTQPTAADAAAVAVEGKAVTRMLKGNGDERVTGTSGNDSFYAGARDTLEGGLGDDRYMVGDGQMVVEKPGGGVDTVIYTGNRTYYLEPNVENITIIDDRDRPLGGKHMQYLGDGGGPSAVGNELANRMVGSKAGNTLDGRAGNDVLIGGEGDDVFVFGFGYGQDRVADFTPGVDRIRIVSGFRTAEEVLAALKDTSAGAVLRTSNGDTLTLTGRKVAELKASDFEMPLDASRYRLVFHDEFTSLNRLDGRTGEDGGTWRTRMASGDGSMISYNEAAALIDKTYKDLGVNPLSVTGGVLTIEGSWRPDLKSQLDGREFVSGVITSEGSFAQLYGYFEARIKVGDWTGGFPAFWLLPADHTWPPEIDIMEQVGREPGTIYQMGNSVKIDPTAWHTYALEWTQDRIAWFVDGQMTHVVYDHNQHKPMYMILNYTLGGTWAGPVATPTTPGGTVGKMQVDYVRAYELRPGDPERVDPATDAHGAPLVVYSLANVAVGGTPAAADSFRHLADTTGKLRLNPDDFDFASQRGYMEVVVDNSRANDAYAARNSNGHVGLHVQISDSDGGSFTLDAMTLAELHLGGTRNSDVTLTRVQRGLIETGAGNDTVSIASHQVWATTQAATIEVSTGAGNDLITGWTGGAASARLLVSGGAGNDTIIGSNGNDTVHGGTGSDRLTGRGGFDVFEFRHGDVGADIVTDFEAGQDRILLRDYAVRNATVRDDLDGVLLDLGDQTVLLLGAERSAIVAALDWAP